jgi:hypothetical protein
MVIDDIARSHIRLMCFVLGLFAFQILLGQEIGSQSGSSVPKEVTEWFQSYDRGAPTSPRLDGRRFQFPRGPVMKMGTSPLYS